MSARAAIDIGSNSLRLLVVDDAGVEQERRLLVTRLGQDLGRTGRLAPEAVARTLDGLREFRALMDTHGVTRARAGATAAARRADPADTEAFCDAAAEVLGVRPDVLSGDEEGHLAFAGAVSDLDPADGPFLVCDLGGGSTELALGSESCQAVRSMGVGSVSLTEAYLHGDPPRPDELSSALSVVETHLLEVVREIPEVREARQIVGLAGTVTTIAAVEIGLVAYDRDRLHHFWLSREAAEDVFRTLATEALADRLHNPGLPADRADVIVGGCCVLVGILRFFGATGCLVSERDILDGLLATVP